MPRPPPRPPLPPPPWAPVVPAAAAAATVEPVVVVEGAVVAGLVVGVPPRRRSRFRIACVSSSIAASAGARAAGVPRGGGLSLWLVVPVRAAAFAHAPAAHRDPRAASEASRVMDSGHDDVPRGGGAAAARVSDGEAQRGEPPLRDDGGHRDGSLGTLVFSLWLWMERVGGSWRRVVVESGAPPTVGERIALFRFSRETEARLGAGGRSSHH